MVTEFLNTFTSMGGSALKWFLIILVGMIILAIFITIGIWAYRRKKWNLRVEVKLLRSDGNYKDSEIAKGHYDIALGIVDIKRKGMKPVGMKPFNLSEFVQGSRLIEVLQVGPKEYIPIHPDSFDRIKYTDPITKEVREKIVMSLKADLQQRKVWKTYMERTAKDRFTLAGFLDKHWRAIEISIILFVMFVGFAILWMKMPKCGVA